MGFDWRWYPAYPRATHDWVVADHLAPAGNDPPWIPMSLCLHADPGGDPDEPFYTSVWLRWSDPVRRPKIGFLSRATRSEARAWLASEAARPTPRYPYLIGAAGAPPHTRFALVTADSPHPTHPGASLNRPMRKTYVSFDIPVTELDTTTDLPSVFDYFQRSGWFPEWVAPYGSFPGNAHAAVVWREQPSLGGREDPEYSDGWFPRVINFAPGERAKEANDVLRKGHSFPRVLGMIDRDDGAEPHQVMLHEDQQVTLVNQVTGVSASSIEPTVELLAGWGYWPLSIMGSDIGPDLSFNIVHAWGGHVSEPPRVLSIERLRSSGFPERAAEQAQSGGQFSALDATRLDGSSPSGAVSASLDDAVHRAARARASSIDASTLAGAPAAFEPPESTITFGSQSPDLSAEQAPGDPGNINPDILVNEFAGFDDYVIGLMRQYSVRGAQLAVAYEGKLKYAPAYTWAPSSYPRTRLIQRMRLGSVSKVLASMALVRLSEGGAGNTATGASIDLFNTDMATLLAPGGAAHDLTEALLGTRTTAQLACHTGYFVDDKTLGETVNFWDAVSFHLARGSSLGELVPMSSDLFLEYVLGTFPPTPGGAGWFQPRPAGPLSMDLAQQVEPSYSNFGFDRLGDVLRLHNLEGRQYLDYLREEVLWPLGVPDARINPTVRTADAAQSDDSEVRYHALVNLLSGSVQAGPVLIGDDEARPSLYGTFNYDATAWQLGEAQGYVALTAIDVARVLSSFDLPGQHPVFQRASSIEELIGETYAKNRTLGFFTRTELGSGRRYLMHNGLYVGTSSIAFRRDDSLVCVLTFNNDIWDAGSGDQLPGDSGLGKREMLFLGSIADAVIDAGMPDWNLFEAPGVLDS